MKRVCLPLVAAFAAVLAAAGLPAAETAGKGFPLRTASLPATPAPVPSRPAAVPPTTVQTGPAPAEAYENQPIAFSGPRRRPAREGEEREYAMPSIWPALLAVAGVCGLFCAGLYCIKKYLPGHRQLFSHPAMEVLGRTHLDQRRYVSLLRVGKRIVVVGVSPDEMRPLSEITDEAEITGILEVARPKTEAGLTIFQRLFQRTMVEAEAEETRAMADVKARQLGEQLSSLKRRVAGIQRAEEPAADSAPPPQRRRSVDRVG